MKDIIFSAEHENSIITVYGAGPANTSAPRHHAKGSGFLVEYILSGEECIESPDVLEKAGIGSLIIISPGEECVLYKERGTVSAFNITFSSLLLEAVSDIISLPRIFCKTGTEELLDVFFSLQNLYKEYSAGSAGAAREICEILFSLFLTAASLFSAESKKTKPSAEKIKEYLHLCICGDTDLDAIGRHFGITGMHVIRLFRNKYDLTPMQYLKIIRLEKAAELLVKTDMSIKNISNMLRFSSTQHFTNFFREHFGIAPGKYRENGK